MEKPEVRSRPATTRRTAAAIACGVVLAIFPDVILLGASFRNSRVAKMFEPKPESRALIPEEEGRRIRDGYRDLGAAMWQLEPEHRFMHRCLTEGQSPYWNPYSASGTHGPERLTSMSFSVLTLATAALGASSLALHAVLLTAFVVACYCLFRSLTLYLGRSVWAATASCFAFLLAGFHTSMLGSTMVQPYLLGPILLLAMLSLVKAPTAGRFLRAVLAHSLVLAETFLPISLLTLISVHALSLAYGFKRWQRLPASGDESVARSMFRLLRGGADRRDLLAAWSAARDGLPGFGTRQLAMQGVASVLGLLLLAPLVFPIVESVSMSEWQGRHNGTARPYTALSLATPKHFWQSYDTFGHSRSFDNSTLSIKRLESHGVFHLGVVGLLLAFQAFAGRRSRRDPVALIAGLLMLLAVFRYFGPLPPKLLRSLPVVSVISDQYWGAMVCFPFCILLAYGVDALSRRTVWRWPTLAVLGFLGASFFFLMGRLGLAEADPVRFHLQVFGGLIAAVLSAFTLLRWRPRSRRVIVAFLVTLMAGELIFYMNRKRPVRSELDFAKVPWVDFLRTNLGDARVLNVGGSGKGLYPNWGSALGIPQIGSLDGVNLRWYGEFFDERFSKDWVFLALRRDRPLRQIQSFDLDALDLLAVRYVLVSGARNYRKFFSSHGFKRVFKDRGIVVFENPAPLPRAQVVDALLDAPGIPSDQDLSGRRVALTTDQDLLDTATRLGVPSLAPPESAGGAGTVEIVEHRHARVVLEATLAEPGVVVLADTWHPAWRARVDSGPIPIGRVNEVLRGVALPAGSHRIVMTYAPRSLPLAIAVSLSIAIFLSWTIWAAKRRPSPS